MKKLKTYVLMLAHSFPSHHYKKGDATQFYGKCLAGVKIHTIRINAELWRKRIDEVNAGRAIISVREWTGKSYKSTQRELFKMYKCGYEYIEKSDTLGMYVVTDFPSDPVWEAGSEYQEGYLNGTIPKNDGLTIEEFNSWFSKIDTRENLIIIHFADFRYTKEHSMAKETYLTHTYQSN